MYGPILPTIQRRTPVYAAPLAPDPRSLLGGSGMQLQAAQRPRVQARVNDFQGAQSRALADALREGQSIDTGGNLLAGLAKALTISQLARGNRSQEITAEQDRTDRANERMRLQDAQRDAARAETTEDYIRMMSAGDPAAAAQMRGNILGERRAIDNAVAEEIALQPVRLQGQVNEMQRLAPLERENRVALAQALAPVETEAAVARESALGPVQTRTLVNRQAALMPGALREAESRAEIQSRYSPARGAQASPQAQIAIDAASDRSAQALRGARAAYEFMAASAGGIGTGLGRRLPGGAELRGGDVLRGFSEDAIAASRVAGSGPFTDADANRAEQRVPSVFATPEANRRRADNLARNAVFEQARTAALDDWVQQNGNFVGFEQAWLQQQPAIIAQIRNMSSADLGQALGLDPGLPRGGQPLSDTTIDLRTQR